MPDYTGAVQYNSAGTHCLCRHCQAEIERGTDYAVLLYFPEDTEKTNPIGPYCSDCMSQLKVCCDCNKAYFGDDIKYFQNGIYYCGPCAATKDICGSCGETHNIKMFRGKKICNKCFDKDYFECGKCNEVHEHATQKENTDLNKAMYANMIKRWGDVCDGCFTSLKPRYKAKKVYKCKSCEKIHSRDHKYCLHCYQNLPKCHFCKEPTHDYKTVADHRNHMNYTVCNKCKPSTCAGCGVVTIDKMRQKKGLFGMRSVCNSCFSGDKVECVSCLTYASVGDDGKCGSCTAIESKRCPNCNEVTAKGGTHCRACHADYAEILSYSYKPQPIFHYTKEDVIEGDNIFMGFEDEVTCSSNVRSVLKNIYSSGINHTIMNAKSDASISGYGFEMVSHPFTLRALKERNWDAMFAEVKSHQSCGMHVHFDRRCLSSTAHLYKIVSFIHENEMFCNEVAGREYNGYNSKLSDKASKIVKKGQGKRSQRVNLNNKATVEIRMFASADRPYKFLMRMEFVHAIIQYTRDASIVGCNDHDEFRKFVSRNKRRYSNLYKFITSTKRSWNS